MDSLKTETIRLSKQADVFINKTATQTLTSTQLVETVVKFHFKDLIKALRLYHSVEITGFGRFDISQNKLSRKLKDLYRIKAAILNNIGKGKYLRSVEVTERQLVKLDEEIEYLTTRQLVDETKLEQYYRRMEESSSTPRETKGSNQPN